MGSITGGSKKVKENMQKNINGSHIFTNNDVIINTGKDSLRIFLSKNEKRRRLFFFIFLPLFLTALCIWLAPFVKEIKSLKVTIFASSILIIIGIMLFNSLVKTCRNFRCTTIVKRDGFIFLNETRKSSQIDVSVLLQPKISAYGYGTSYTIGIKFGKKEIPISFAHSASEAQSIANEIAIFLECKIYEKRILMFSQFTKW